MRELRRGWCTLSRVGSSSWWTLSASVAAHVALAAVLLAHPAEPAAPEPSSEPAPALAGETFELPAPDTQDVPLANASPSADEEAAPAPPEASRP